ncbi:MAG: AAA family ATPase, partial [Clostridia bacterium]|nr:AAA family ATPase [Clostridia bacterium]
SISGSDFVEMFVGVGASRVRDLFDQAKKVAPAIVFIDEIDAVGRHRGAGLGGGHDEREQTLNQILVEMDGFEQNTGIVIIAATNRPDILDPALTRPGRFDRKITVNYPDIAAREKILGVHARNKTFAEDVSFNEVAKNTSGFTAADLENLLNEAALIAARRDSEVIRNEHIKEAIFRVIVGPEKRSHVMSDREKKMTAYHESGHALAVRLYSTTDKVDRISIVPAGSAGGYTAHRPEEDYSYMTRQQLFEQIVVALAGKAAEMIVFGDMTTGASSDLRTANTIAMNMVAKYGMSDAVGNMIMNTGSDEVFLGRDYGHTRAVSEELSSLVDREVKKLIDSAYAKVMELLTENRGKLELVATVLLEKERLEADDFEKLFTNGKLDEPEAVIEAEGATVAEAVAVEEAGENA